jgi:putative DNA methylase
MSSAKLPIPFSLKNAPSLIERALPAQRLSAEAFREQTASHDKTLVTLGGYWKGRKPLILNKACVLGALLPATADLVRDVEIFELLMGMDDLSMAKRLNLSIGEALPAESYRELVDAAKRPEAIGIAIHAHIWPSVNAHLGTNANSIPELVEQLGVMRFGRRPKLVDTFSGSGQIPFEASRLGCDVYASDLNPIACLLTWGAFNIVGGLPAERSMLDAAQLDLVQKVHAEVEHLRVETDGNGWRAKVFLCCAEAKCPQTGWMVPLLSSQVVSKGYKVIAELVPDPSRKRYDIAIRSGVTETDLAGSIKGTVRSDGRGGDSYFAHVVDGIEYRTKIGTLRGDFRREDGSNGSAVRLWDLRDFHPREGDIFQERVYAIEWMRPKAKGKGEEYQFRAVTEADLRREEVVREYVGLHLPEWQRMGWAPEMRIEPGYNTDQPIRERGWTHWHHLFTPRQLLYGALARKHGSAWTAPSLLQALNYNSKLSTWNRHNGGGGVVQQTFINQALNTLIDHGCRSSASFLTFFGQPFKSFPAPPASEIRLECSSAADLREGADIFITDPPYGDAVNYHEILEFFIAWMRKAPPQEFSKWTWDSRRALAIKGQGEEFRRGMVAAYRRMADCAPDNGIHVVMFTHQSGAIWADMANIVWASGLQVTAAWYVVTETDSALREGSYVKGTVLLVLRKRSGSLRASRDDLAWDIKDEVEAQVATLTGLNQGSRSRYRDENLFADADIQMAGYAAALRVLTQYSTIDGRDMAAEAIRPRVEGEKTFVDALIEFAVGVANESLVPAGIEREHWDKFRPVERFYLKMLDLESQGAKSLDNYQNFAKAFKVGDFRPLLAEGRANAARLKSAVELGRAEMAQGSAFANSALRAVLFAVMELVKEVDGADVLAHLSFNIDGFFDPAVRVLLVAVSDFLAGKLLELRPAEASAARVLSELIRSQRL